MARRRHRIVRVLGVSLGAMLLLVALLYLLRGPIFGGLVRRYLARELSSALGGRWTVGGVGGSWISDLSLEDVEMIEPPATGPLVGAGADAVTADYDLLGLVGGRGLAAVHAIHVRALWATLDLDRSGGAPARLPSFVLAPVYDALPRVEADARLRATSRGRVIEAGLRVATVAPRTWRARLDDVRLDGDTLEGEIAGRAELTDPTHLAWTSSTSLDGFGLPALDWRLSGRLSLRVTTPAGDVRLDATGAGVDVAAEGLDLGRIPSWVRGLVPEPGLPTAGRLGVEGTIEDLAGPVVRAHVQASRLTWASRSISYVEVKGRTDREGRIRVESARLEAEGAEAQARDAVVDPASPFLLTNVATLTARIDDLRTVVPGLDEPIGVFVAASGLGRRGYRLEHVEVTARGTTLRGRGDVTLPDDPGAWRRTRIDLDLDARSEDLSRWTDVLDGGADVHLTARGEVGAAAVHAEVEGKHATLADVAVDRLLLDATFGWPALEVRAVTLSAPAAAIEGSGRLSFSPFAVEASTLNGRAADVGRLAAAFGLEETGLRGALAADGSITVEGGRLTLAADLSGTDLALGASTVGAVHGHVAYEGGAIEVSSLEARGGWGHGVLSGRLDVDRGRVDLSSLAADVEGIPVRLEAPVTLQWDGGAYTARGLALAVADAHVRLDASAVPQEGRGTVLALTAERVADHLTLDAPVEVRWGGSGVRLDPLDVTVNGSVHVRTALALDPDATTATVGRLAISGDFGAVRLLEPLVLARTETGIRFGAFAAEGLGLVVHAQGSADVTKGRATLGSLRVGRGDLSLAIGHPAELTWDREGVRVIGLDAVVEGAHVEGRIAYLGGAPSADLTVEGLDVSRLVPAIAGTWRGRVSVRDTSFSVEGTLAGLAGLGLEGDVEIGLRQGEDGGIELSRFRATGARGLALVGTARLPWRLTTSGLARVDRVLPHLDIEGEVPLPAGVSARIAHVHVTGDAEGLHAALTSVALAGVPEGEPGAEVEVRLEATKDRVTLTSRMPERGAVHVEGHATVDGGIDWTDPADLEGFLGASVEGTLSARVASWAPLRALVPTIEEVDGDVRGVVTLGGTVGAPSWRGEVHVTKGRVRIRDFPVVTDVEAEIHVTGDRIEIGRLQGQLGYAPFAVTGSAGLPGADGVPLRLVVRGKRLLLARSDAMRLRADLDLRVGGTLRTPTIAGDARIVDLLYVAAMNVAGDAPSTDEAEFRLFTLDVEPLASAHLDVRVTGDQSIRIRNNLIRADASVDATLGGTGREPVPVGHLTSDTGLIYLPAATLDVQGARIEFLAGEPDRPEIRATALSRASGYELGVRVTGTLPDVELHVFSRPRLSDADAMLLLATGATPGGAGPGGVEGITLQKAFSFFGENLLSVARGTSDPEGGRPFFDRFRLTVGRERTRRGNQTIEAEGQLSEHAYVRIERDKYDETDTTFVWRIRLR